MRLDRIAPRSWLLAATAAWALAAWLLAVAGLGAHARLLADDASLLQPVPQVPGDSRPRLGPLAGYGSVAARPLFASDRRPHPFVLDNAAGDDAAPSAGGFDYMLTSVLIAPPLRMAILQPEGGGEGIRVRLGESAEGIAGWRLVELHPRSAVFEGPGGRESLDLRTWDGNGGESPSQLPTAVLRRRAMDAAAAAEAAQAAEAAAAAAAAARGGASAEDQAAPPAEGQARHQAEAIRKRIEARRAQLRKEAQSTAPARNP